MKSLKFAAILFAAVVSCKNNGRTNHAELTQQSKPVDTAEKEYFPVQEFLLGEIRFVDSLPVGIMKYEIRGKSMDSSYIKMPEFKQLAYQFLSPELDKESFETNFDEVSFYDQNLKYSTFNYSPKKETSSIRRVDVISQGGMGYDKINSIYIEKNTGEAGLAGIKKMYWKAGRHFQIIQQDTAGKQSVTKVVWNYWD